MNHDRAGIVIAFWQLAMAANLVISLAYLAISILILVPTARAHQLRTNKLAVATGLIFFSCSVGHGLHAVQPLLAVLAGNVNEAEHMNNWWLASWHTLTAGVAVYYLTLRRLYGRLLTSAPLFHDLTEQQRLVELEELTALNTAKVEAEGERDAHAAMLHAVIQNSQTMIYVKDLEGRYLLTNPVLDKHFGRAEGSLVGRTDHELDPDLAPLWRANDERARDGLIELEEFNDTPDGRHFYESAKFPLRDGNGEVYATCGISLDVTERRLAAAQAIERDAALAATAAKSAFLATMSHEIRTPLNAVIGMTDLLLNSGLDDRQREFVETVRVSGDALLSLINDILDFSKIESGDLELEAVPFDLRAEAEASLDLVLAAASRKGLELVCDVDQRCPPMVVGDVHRFRQVLTNLLANAVKFTERGEVVLAVETGSVGEGKVRVVATVKDTGMGIAPEHVDRLFRSFSQVDASTTRLHGGSGLGLAISRRLAEAMGGELTLTATSPAGSTFALDVVLDVAPVLPESVDVVAAAIPYLSGKSALLVDDNPTNLRILDYQLSILGLICTSFTAPRAALEQVEQGLRYDVAVLDMHMPDMDGVMLGTALRQIPEVAAAPLVLLTSLGLSPVGEHPFTALLTKPAKRALLHETMIKVMQGHLPRTTPRPVPPPVRSSPKRVLLAEDNVTNQRVAQLMLGELGHHVTTVDNGYDAVEAVTDQTFDVVLMDVQMPQVDGLEATRRIRARLPHDKLPYIVAMTANALREDRDACLAAGMHDYISKPVRLQDLEAVLTKTKVQASPSPALADRTIDEAALERLLSQVGGGEQGARQELIDQYLGEATQQVRLLHDVVAAGDLSRIRSVTHTWRSTSALLGAGRLAVLLQQLERVSSEAPQDCPALAGEVEEEFARVEQTLRQLREAGPTAPEQTVVPVRSSS